MYLWNTGKLATQIASDQLSEESRFQYLIGSNILFAASGYLVWYFADTPAQSEFNYWFEALMVLVITIGGTLKCKEVFSSASNLSLIEAFFILSLPLSIKMFLFISITLFLVPHGIEVIAASDFVESLLNTSYVDTTVDVLNAIYLNHSIAIVLIATSWFYWRMKSHLSHIAETAPNQPLEQTG